MTHPDCAELHARASELHAAADDHMETAASLGVAGRGFTEEVVGAARCERLADEVEAQIAEDC